jgi:outer membrane protein assembly factor BamC
MRPVALRTACAVFLPLAAAGCSWTSWTGSIFTEEKIQYQAADSSRAPLDVPPDLSQLPREERYAVPERPQAVTASGLAQQGRGPLAGTVPGASASATAGGQAVLPGTEIAKVERHGNTRWLAVKLPPEKVWPVLVEFWPSVGLAVARQDAASGTIETTWAENRAKLPQDIIRKTLGKVLDSIYSTGEQDMYRARLERAPDGSSEIFVSHRGMIEVYTSADQTQTKWQPRPADPQLEGEMLARLQARFDELNKPATARGGAKPATAAAATAAAASGPALAELQKANDGRPVAVIVNEPFDRAWRRVGQSLDRVGFTVEDRARDRGIYFVRYLDPDYEAKAKDQQGFFTKFMGKERPVDAPQFQIKLAAEGERTRVTVADKDGKPDTSKASERILSLIEGQLR